jgi:hypothetical protein
MRFLGGANRVDMSKNLLKLGIISRSVWFNRGKMRDFNRGEGKGEEGNEIF